MHTLRWLACCACLGALLGGCPGPSNPPPADTGARDGGSVDTGTLDTGTDGGGTDAGTDAGACTDLDEDGYGEGCELGDDCADDDEARNPGATETCNGVDDDCSGTEDDGLTAPACEMTMGVCAGATATCGGASGFACDATSYGADYEADETSCDSLDNDCDGTTDEGCTCTDGMTQPCGTDTGECTAGTQTCAGGTWGACVGEVGSMGETCDGRDNDCDGSSDEPTELTPPACPLQLGVCAGSTRTCGGVAGYIACSGVGSYGGDYQATESLCDGLDNDCDGITDEGCTCIDGATQPCGTDVGACMAGTQTCTAGTWGGCAGEVAATTETCDGADNDCDGTVDAPLTAPACALVQGVCAGATQRCTGAGGFVACTATEYGANYQATETRCDGRDNDCDGTTDEGCTCVDGTMQDCGSAVGVCTRGRQTCTGGTWGACTGGTAPMTESCNGLDDDCNGTTDDGLTPPACALTMGVCAGTVAACGGASGFGTCTAADYGPRYSVTEDGATNEAACDGLDNDCDGMADEGCTSGVIVGSANDEVLPTFFHQHLAYLENLDGNWDVMFQDLNTGTARRITTTAVNEGEPRVYGNYLAYERGDDAASMRVVLYNLATNVETVVSTLQSGAPAIYGGNLLFQEFDGTQWDIRIYNLATGMTTGLFAAATPANEGRPSMRGNVITYISDESGTELTWVVDLGATVPAPVVATPARTSMYGHLSPVADYTLVGWTDGRFLTTSSLPTDDWDIYGAPLAASGTLTVFPGDNVVASPLGGQLLRTIDGGVFAYSDYAAGNWDVTLGNLSGAVVHVTSSTAAQADPAICGAQLVWEDNRLGNFDIFGTNLGGVAVRPVAGSLVINEVLADPAAGADVNGDGTASTTGDEFVEIYNVTASTIDISGLTVSDSVSVRHTFGAGETLPPFGAVVVFGGGRVARVLGGAYAVIASSGALGLNNDADSVILRDGTTVIDQVMYSGSLANGDQSIVRTDELTAGSPMIRHSTAMGTVGAYSPGTNVRGFGF